ncbi:uncharacterized protein LOC111613876 [Centruroides sculpturatus]|uniref:uncharacterized protein LOC111613876 n=1 Tax=Centruroides sculpturatus TaxID=218467 RepID=UPI000C6EBEC4|nr:uncharacterized protein LOC111613876 [Centruroides sculpturatus]
MSKSEDPIKVARVSVKIPPFFWRKNVRVWFTQVESQLAVSNITTEVTKYHHILGSLDCEIAELVANLISQPLTSTPYTGLKTRLIDKFEESESRKAKKLLLEIELGEKKPSALLREMRALAGTQVTDKFLKTLFLQRLPNNVRSVLVTKQNSLHTLAAMEIIIRNSDICSTSGATAHQTDRLSCFEKAVSELAILIHVLRAHSPSCSERRRRSPSPNVLGYNVCWYHFKFKANARKCTPPCSLKRAIKEASGND